MNNGLSPIFQEIRPLLVDLLSEALVSAFQKVEADQPRYPERVSVEKASEITGYSKNSLYQMHSRGTIPGAHKVGGKLLFETKVLLQWVEAGGKNQKMGNLTPIDGQTIKKEKGLPQVAKYYGY